MLDGDDLRRRPLSERKATLRKVLRRTKDGIPYAEHVDGDGAKMFAAACKLGLKGIVSKKIDEPYRSVPFDQGQEPAAATRIINGAF